MTSSACTTFDRINRIWSGPDLKPLYNPDISIGQVVLHILDRDPNKIAQISDNDGVHLTNADIRIRSIRIAQCLKNMNFKEGNVIGIVCKNTENLAPVVFGAFLCGTPINTLDPILNKGEIIHMFQITRPKLVFCDDDNFETVQDALKDINLDSPIYTIRGRVKGTECVADLLKPTKTEKYFSPPKLKNPSTTPAAILCSSGTTGPPKGVPLSHFGILQQLIDLLDSSDVILCFSSLYWLSGLMMLTSGTLFGATRIITDKTFSPELMLDLIEKYQVTFLFTPPSQMVMTVQSSSIDSKKLNSLKIYFCTGSQVPSLYSAKMSKHLKNGHFCLAYGMTELAGGCSWDYPATRWDSVGQLNKNVKVKLMANNGTFLDIDEPGEICIKMPFTFLGYYGNDDATRNFVDRDGWLHTGDIGQFDCDGYLCILDRKKDIMKYKNYHITPSELEDLLLELPGVLQVCVSGIPDAVAGDLPAAIIVKDVHSRLTEKDICEYIAKNVSDFKQLRGGAYFIDALPMTASGKIQRNKAKIIAIERYNLINKLE